MPPPGPRGRPAALVTALLALILVALALPAAATAQSPLVGQWHLDEVRPANPEGEPPDISPDSSGNDRHLTSCNGCLPISPGGGRFGGHYPDSGSAAPRAGPGPSLQRVTLIAWVRASSFFPDARVIAGRGIEGGSCQNMPYGLFLEGGDALSGASFRIRRPDGSSVSSPTVPGVADNQWHMLAGTFDGSRVRLYADGHQIGSGTPAGTTSIGHAGEERFGIDGYAGSCPTADFPGGIDEVREYDRALSPTEIGRLANPAATTPPVLQPDRPPAPAVTSLTQSSPQGPLAPLVVDADVDGAHTRLDWTVGGRTYQTPPSQDALRITPRGSTRITVRPFGPGGAGTARSLVVRPTPKPQDPVTKKIVDAINKAPIVLSFGPAAIQRLISPNPSLKKCKNVSFFSGNSLFIQGCLQPLTSLDDVPSAERGVLTRLTQQYGIPNNKAAIEKAVKHSHAFIGFGPTVMNGVTLSPSSGAAVLGYPQANAIVSSNAKQAIGQLKLKTSPKFLIDTALKNNKVPLGAFGLQSGSLKKIGDFGLGKLVTVDLMPAVRVGNASFPPFVRITVNLSLPSFLKIGGGDAKARVVLNATVAKGLILDSVRVGPMSPKIGPLAVTDFRIDYSKSKDEWRGQGKACVAGGTCLDMVPAAGSVVIKNGDLQFAGATLGFPSPGPPLFAGVHLRKIGFNVGLNPTRFGGTARVIALKIYEINGRMNMAFPSSRTPFIFDEREVGPGYPRKLYGQRFDRTTLALSANASMRAPVVGKVPLGSGYLVYEYPGYVAFGGGVEQSFLGIVSITGRVDGELNIANQRFNTIGSVNGCLIKVLCRGATGLISSRGLSLCMHVGPLNIGGGATWRPFKIRVWPLDGCKWSPFSEQNVRGSGSASGPLHEVKIGKNARSRAIELAGATAAPRVRVTGPGGQVLDSPAASGFVRKGSLRIIRQEPSKLTVVGLQDPKPGTYRVELLPGSPAVKSLGTATDPPDAKVSASVSGKRAQRVLRYNVRRRKAQRVTFTEVDGRVSRVIGAVNGGGKGKIRFKPAPGRNRRKVVAQFELGGMPAERRTVARFTPLRPTLPKVKRLKVKRARGALRVQWKRVAGAARYEVVVTGSTGQRLRQTSKRRIKIKKVPTWSSGTVSVRALASGREGRLVKRRFKATRKPPTRVRKMPKPPRL